MHDPLCRNTVECKQDSASLITQHRKDDPGNRQQAQPDPRELISHTTVLLGQNINQITASSSKTTASSSNITASSSNITASSSNITASSSTITASSCKSEQEEKKEHEIKPSHERITITHHKRQPADKSNEDTSDSQNAIGSRQVKKSASMEKAEQWLKERMEQKVKSRKNSETGHETESENQVKHSSVLSNKKQESIPLGRTNELNAKTSLIESAFNRGVSPPPSATGQPASNTTLPSRFRGMNFRTSQDNSSQSTSQPPPPRRGSVFDHRRGSSAGTSTTTSRAGSPGDSRATSPGPTGKPYYSPTKMATVVPTPNNSTLSRSRSKSVLVDQETEKETRSAWREGKAASYFDKAKSVQKEVSSAFKYDSAIDAISRRSSKEEIKSNYSSSRRPSVVSDSSDKPRSIKEFSPVVLVRPSTFIQSSNASNDKKVPEKPSSGIKPVKPAEPAKPAVVTVGPSTFLPSSSNSNDTGPDKNQDRIPSRFRKAMQHNNNSSSDSSTGMFKSKSIHELNEASLGSRATGLQDKIRQARADHRKVFDEAQSHTTYGSKGFANSNNHSSMTRGTRETPEWLNRSMRSLRASPATSRF